MGFKTRGGGEWAVLMTAGMDGLLIGLSWGYRTSAVIDREGHQVILFSHFSITEFLTSERLATAEESLSYYHILPEAAHTVLAQASLTVLLQLDDKIDRNTIGHFPTALYAVDIGLIMRRLSQHKRERKAAES